MDDHTPDAINLSEQLCPIDERRDTRELYLKLFVVSFTTLYSYYRLLRIKENSCLTWSPLYFWLAPLNYIFSYILGLIFIFSIYVSSVVSKRSNPRPNHLTRYRRNVSPEARLKANLRCLFGKVPPNGFAYYSTLKQNQPVVRDGAKQAWNPMPRTWEETAEMVGRLVAVIFFLAQCVGTIVLYQRRRENHAVCTLDQRVFELACAGLLAGILTLCHTLRVPIFDQTVPDYLNTDEADTISLFFRDVCPNEGMELVGFAQLFKHLAITRLVCLIFNYHPGSSMLSDEVSVRSWWLYSDGVLSFFLWCIVGMGAFSGICFFCILIFDTVDHKRPQSLWGRGRYYVVSVLTLPVCIIFGVIGSVVVMEVIFLALIPFWWIFQSLQDLGIADLDNFKTHATNVPCPELIWTDPVAERIPWLA